MSNKGKRDNYLNTQKGKYLLSISVLILLILVVFREYLSWGVMINASDIWTQDYFFKAFHQDRLRSSPTFMGWNPYINGGAAFNGGFHLVFEPINLFYNLILPPNLSITASGLTHLLMGGAFSLFYARIIGLGFRASFLVAIFFIFSTQIVSLFNAGHVNKLNTISYFPVVMFLLERAFQKRGFIDFLLVGLALSLQLYETHIQISFYTCICVGIYFIWRSVHIYQESKDSGELKRIYLSGTAMVLMFFALSAATFSQWLEFKEQSDRQEGMPYEQATNWSMSKVELSTYVVPQLFGLARENYKDPGKIKAFYWGGDLPFTQTADYLGLLPLVLAVIALFKSRGRYVRMALALAIFYQILAMGKYTPIYSFFYYNLGFKFFRVPKMGLFVVAFFVAIMAGFGAQWIIEKFNDRDKHFYKRFICFVLAFASSLGIIAIVANLNQNQFIDYFISDLRGQGRSFNPSLAVVVNRYQNAVDGIWLACALFFTLSGLLALRLLKRVKVGLLFGLLAAFFMIDISILNDKFIDSVPLENNIYIEKDTAVKYFEKDRGLYRVFNAVWDRQNKDLAAYQVPNKYILYKIQSVTGYEAVPVARYSNFLGSLNLNNNIIDLLNVKYVVMDKKAVKGGKGSRLGKFTIVVDEDVKILRNENVIPRAFVVHRAMYQKDSKKILNWLANPAFNPRETVLIEEPVPSSMPLSPGSEIASRVSIYSYKDEEIGIDVDMAENGFVVLSEKHYPGWKAYLNGEAVKLYIADYTLRAVFVPKGTHKLTIKYEPDFYNRGLYITFTAIMLFVSVFVWNFCLVGRACSVVGRKEVDS